MTGDRFRGQGAEVGGHWSAAPRPLDREVLASSNFGNEAAERPPTRPHAERGHENC